MLSKPMPYCCDVERTNTSAENLFLSILDCYKLGKTQG